MGARGGEGPSWSIRPGQLLWKLSDSARQLRHSQTLTPEAALGRRGEDLAHRYLRSLGFTILSRNYRPGGGDAEVDIVARDGETTVFVEVKTRTSAEYGSPDRAIGAEKQKNIMRAARAFATRAEIDWSRVRFDVVSIVLGERPSIVHQRDAFFEGRSV